MRLTVRNRPEPVEQGDVDTEQCGEVEAVPHHLGDRPGEHHGRVQRVLAGLLISTLQTWERSRMYSWYRVDDAPHAP